MNSLSTENNSSNSFISSNNIKNSTEPNVTSTTNNNQQEEVIEHHISTETLFITSEDLQNQDESMPLETSVSKRKLISENSTELCTQIILTDPPPPGPLLLDSVATQSQSETPTSPLSSSLTLALVNTAKSSLTSLDLSLPPTTIQEAKSDEDLLAETTYQLKKRICLSKLRQLNTLRLQSLNNLSEQYYLEQNYNFLSYTKFLNSLNGSSLKLTADLKDYIQTKFPLDQKHDLNNLETRLANKFSISLLTSSNSPNTTTPPTSSTQATSSSETSNQIVSSLGSHMDTKQQQSIAERARHEAHIIQRITQLRKEGLWSIKRLPKLVEPQRAKTHWDFLLDEMTWMSTDFQQERKWKKNSCKKLSIAIQKYFKDKELKAELAEREETKRLRKQAGMIARDIMQFWRNVERIIEYKQKSLIEEKRKQAMDLHLNFIVDQTEKYSSWLIESLANQNSVSSATLTDDAETSGQMNTVMSSQADQDEYEMESEVADDESTIEKEEQLEEQAADDSTNDELKQLQMESEIPIEDLLRDYNIDDSYFSSAAANKNSNKSELNSLLIVKSSANSNSSMDVDMDDRDQEQEEEEDDDEIDEEENDSSTIYCTDDEELNEDDEETIEKEEKLSNDSKQNDKLTDNLLSIDDLLPDTNKTKEEQPSASDASGLVSEVTTTVITETVIDTNKQEDSTASNNKEVLTTIAAQAQSLQPTGYTLETTNVKTKIPSQLLKHTLREYQHVGLDWLVTINENKLNGILADEMGLGKTIQTIALLAHLACEKGVWGPHLIVVPTSVMLNWELEFKKWCPGFKILTYYGSPKDRKLKRQGWTKVNAFHVCITSYKLVIQDHAAFRRKKWKYFILDEAQNIKNFKSQRWQCLLNFQSQRRLLLTGTPLQNNLMELWSLMHFLMPHVFSSHREFQHWFSNPLKCMIEGNQEYNEQLIRRLHKVLRPFILRRLKIDVEKQMPKKYEHVVMCKLSKRQRLLYDEFMSLPTTRNKLAEGQYLSVINILMQLRKVCNHPDLFEPRPIVSSFVTEPIHYHVPSIVFNLSEQIHSDRLNQILFYQPGLADMELLYSVFECHRSKQLQTSRKLIEEIVSKLNPIHSTDQQMDTNQTSGNSLLNHFFVDSSLQGLAINDSKQMISTQLRLDLNRERSSLRATQMANDHLKDKLKYMIRTNKWHCGIKPIYGQDLHACVGKEQIIQATKNRPSTGYAVCQRALLFQHSHNKSISTNGFWSNTNTLCILLNLISDLLYAAELNHEMFNILSRFVVYVPHVVYAAKASMFDPLDACSTNSGCSIRLHVAHPEPSLYSKQRTLIEDITNKASKFSSNLLTSKVESMMSTQFPEKRLIQYDCGKLQILSDLLRQLYAGTHRVLLFTQMTRMLDILENFLNYHGYKYLRLDGSTSIEQRQVLMDRFNKDKRIFCFILSTRSGGIGVNLTGADTVIFYDSDWNPTMDAQAQDRCHRIGQTRDVHIYRLISTKTVEENILKKANQKRLLSDMTIEGGNFTTALLKKHHISELFNDDQEIMSPLPSNNTTATAATEPCTAESIVIESLVKPGQDVSCVEPSLNESHFEAALAKVEDDIDVQAAKELKAEVHADIAEFDENNIEMAENENGYNADEINDDPMRRQLIDMNRLESEFKSIETELKPIERYALKFLESYGNIVVIDEEKEIQIEKVKKDWELNRLKQLKEDEERKAEQEEDDMMYTYTKTEVSTTHHHHHSNLKSKNKNLNKKKNSKTKKSFLNTSKSTAVDQSSNYVMNTRRKTTLLSSSSSININLSSPTKTKLSLSSTGTPTKKLLKLKNTNKKRMINTKNRKQQLNSTARINSASNTTNSLIDNELVKFKKLNEKANSSTELTDLNSLANSATNLSAETTKYTKEERQKQFESSIMKSIKRAAARSKIKAAADDDADAAQLEQTAIQSSHETIKSFYKNDVNTIKINNNTQLSPKSPSSSATDATTASTAGVKGLPKQKVKKVSINQKLKEKKAKKIKTPVLNAINSRFIRHLINTDINSPPLPPPPLQQLQSLCTDVNTAKTITEETATPSTDLPVKMKKPRVNRKPKKEKQIQQPSLAQPVSCIQQSFVLKCVNSSNQSTDLTLIQNQRSKSPTISSLIAQQNQQQQPKVAYLSSGINNSSQSGLIRTIVRPTQVHIQQPQLQQPHHIHHTTNINLASTINRNPVLSTLKTITCPQPPTVAATAVPQKLPATLTLTQANLTGSNNKPILITKPLNHQPNQAITTPQTKYIIKATNTNVLNNTTAAPTLNKNFWLLNRPTQVTPITATCSNNNNTAYIQSISSSTCSSTVVGKQPPLTVVVNSSPNKNFLNLNQQQRTMTIVNNKDSLIKTVNLLKTNPILSTNQDLTSSSNIVNNVLAQTKSINSLMKNTLDTKFS